MRRRACVIGLVIVVSVSCKASYPTTPTASPVAFWVHYWTPVGLGSVGSIYAFSAFVLASDGAYEDVTARAVWSESDSQILIKSRSFTFPSAVAYSAAAPGNVEIAAQYLGLRSSIVISVIRPDRRAFPNLGIAAVSPRVMGESARSVLRWNQSATISDTVTELATWSSSDTRVVTVDRGLISAVAPGTAVVTASYNGQLAWYGLSIPPPDR
ncbi:MAG: Ig-like domain-containing protein [Vicinamibacterales bacterium]